MIRAGLISEVMPGPSLMLGPGIGRSRGEWLSGRIRRHGGGRRRRGRAADDQRPLRARRKPGQERDQREPEHHRLHMRLHTHPPSVREHSVFSLCASAGLRVHAGCQSPDLPRIDGLEAVSGYYGHRG